MFTRRIHTEREIDAPPEAVWDVLTDLASYEEWNPNVTFAAGALEVGADVDLRVQPTRGRERSITATVTEVTPERTLQWVGTAGGRWLFEGRHTFELRPLDGGRTRFVNRERVRGLAAPLVVRSDSARAYEAMNRALAERVEGRSA
ncbi:SRPBCC family protein [Salinigranum sp. GCM10025319]|uniref:SRPBCC family protein n=1 Tax=Salinigranum sp. GCM10025319 TaxID=3252687 RepID=UPI0036154FF1